MIDSFDRCAAHRVAGRHGRALACVLGLTLALVACQPPVAESVSPQSGWSVGPLLRTARDDFGLVALGGKLYAFGGMSGARGRAVRSMEVLEPAAGRWEVGPPMRTPRYSFGAAVSGDSLYVVGGDDGETTSARTERFDPATQSWTRLAEAPTIRYAMGAAELNGSIYLAGGRVEIDPIDAFERYEVATNRWVKLRPMPTPRAELLLLAFDGLLYAIGGSTPGGRDTTMVEVYDPSADRWRQGPSLPEPVVRGAGAALGARLHVLVRSKHFILERGRAQWSVGPPAPTSRKGAGAAALAGALFLVGGCSDEPRDLSVTERYAPP